jgi:hypothetical protein
MPTRCSSRATARLTPDWVIPSDAVARAKLPASTTATKTWIPLNSRLSKAIVSLMFSHVFYDQDALLSSNVQRHLVVVASLPAGPASVRQSRRRL